MSAETAEDVPWASYADALAGMLFIFIILSFAFAIRLATAEEKAGELQQVVNDAVADRDALVGDFQQPGALTECLQKHFEKAEPEKEQGRISLLLTGNGWFEKGSAELGTSQQAAVREIGRCLEQHLGKSSLPSTTGRAPASAAPIEKYRVLVFLEGHTDVVPTDPSNPKNDENWTLSAQRATVVLEFLLEVSDVLRAWFEDDGGDFSIFAVGMAYHTPPMSLVQRERDHLQAARALIPVAASGRGTERNSCAFAEGSVLRREKIRRANGCDLPQADAEVLRRVLRRVDLRLEFAPRLGSLGRTSP